MHQQQNPIPHQSDDQDYEISILDILVVLAENLRLIILVPVVVGLVTLGISYLLPTTYDSFCQLKNSETSMPEITCNEVYKEVLKKSYWIKGETIDDRLINLRKVLKVSKDNSGNITIYTKAKTPERATEMINELIEAYKVYSLPKGKVLEGILANIKISEEYVTKLKIASQKISQNLDKVTPGWEGDNVARAYTTINSTLATQEINLFNLRQSLTAFKNEAFIQPTIIPEKKSDAHKAQITIMATLASGFLTILFVLILAGFRNLCGDAEASEKLARIRKAIGLK